LLDVLKRRTPIGAPLKISVSALNMISTLRPVAHVRNLKVRKLREVILKLDSQRKQPTVLDYLYLNRGMTAILFKGQARQTPERMRWKSLYSVP
jgi:hypothetical protein